MKASGTDSWPGDDPRLESVVGIALLSVTTLGTRHVAPEEASNSRLTERLTAMLVLDRHRTDRATIMDVVGPHAGTLSFVAEVELLGLVTRAREPTVQRSCNTRS